MIRPVARLTGLAIALVGVVLVVGTNSTQSVVLAGYTGLCVLFAAASVGRRDAT